MTQPIQFGIRVIVDGSQAIPEVNRIGTTLTSIGTAGAQAGQIIGANMAGVSRSANDAATSVISLAGAEQNAAAAIRTTSAEALQQERAMRQNAQALGTTSQQLQRNALSAGELRNALRGVPAQFTDIVTSLQGGQNPLTVFLQQGGQLRDQFGSASLAARSLGGYVVSLVNPFTVAAAAAAVLGVAYYQGSQEGDAFRLAIINTGGAAGVSAGQLQDMARSIGDNIGTQGKAAEVLAELASGGKIVGDNLRRLGEQAIGAEKYLGQSIKTTGEHLADLGEKPLETSVKLNAQYHFLTAAVFDHIKALQDQGRVEEAGVAAQKAYGDALAARSAEAERNLGSLQRAWNWVADGAKGAWDSMLDVGREDTLDEKLTKAEAQLRRAKANRYTFQGGGSDGKAAIKEADDLVKRLKEQKEAEEWSAKQKAETVRLDEAHIKFVQAGAAYLDKETRLQQELNRQRQLGLEAGASDADIEKRLKAVREKYQEKPAAGSNPAKAVLDGKLAGIRAEVDADRAKYAQLESMAGLYHRAQQTSDEQYYATRIDILSKASGAELAGYDKQLAALRAFHGKTAVERQDNANKIADVQGQRARAEQQYADKRATLDTEEELRKQTVLRNSDDELNKYLRNLAQEAEKEEAAVASRQASRAAIEQETVARLDLALAYQRQFVEEQRQAGANAEEIAQGQRVLRFLEDQRTAHQRLGAAIAKGDGLKLDDKMWKDAENDAKNFAKSLEDAFGNVGGAIGKMSLSLVQFGKDQRDLQLELSKEKGLAQGDPDKVAKAELNAQKSSAQSQIKLYGDMTKAASGFFNQNSKGYKALHAAEQTFRAFELAMAIETATRKIFLSDTVASAKIGAIATETAANAASVAPNVAADGTKASASGVAAFAKTLASLPFPANVAAGAAVVALLVAAGVKMSGGGGGGKSVAQQRQEAQGTGSVLGDPTAKSESIAKSLDLIEKYAEMELAQTGALLTSVRNIENSISGLGGVLARNGINGVVAEATGGSNGIIGKALGSIFGGKVSTIDTGITASQASLAAVMSSGLNASKYTDTKKSGGWFSSDKYRTEMTALSAEANDQLSKVISGLAGSVTEAAKLIGVSGSEFDDHLKQFVVDIGKISFKDLSGEEIQKQLEAVFSKVGDDLAKFGVSGLEKYQKVGEGYFETLVRVANNYATLDATMASIGATFGAVGTSSIAARERLIELAGGLDKLVSQTDFFRDNFLSEEERSAPVIKMVKEQLAGMGLASITTKEQFKALALGLDRTTEAGAKQYTQLLALAPAFNTAAEATAAAIDKAKDAAKIATDAIADAQDTLNNLYQNETSVLQALIKARQDEAAAIQKQINALKLSDLSTLTPEQKYLEAKRQFENAKPEDKSAAAQAFLEASRNYYGSTTNYAKDYALVQAALSKSASAAQSAANVAQQQLDQLKAQVGSLIKIEENTKSITQAILDLANALKNSPKPSDVSQSDSAYDKVLASTYKELLQRDPDAAGLAFWKDKLKNGLSYADLIAGFKGSEEYQLLHGSHANGLEYVPFDGYRAELHQGERVQTAAQVANERAAMAQTVSLLTSLIEEAKADKTQRGAVATATLDKLEQVTEGLDNVKRQLARKV